ncbi:MAG: GH116 family glycosyl hydrolase [Thermoguttaceae bacterium]
MSQKQSGGGQHRQPKAGPLQGLCQSTGSCSGVDRRRFLAATGAGLASLVAAGGPAAIAGPFAPKDLIDHFVPADKRLRPEWIKPLFARGQKTWYSGGDLKMIAMPVGGITTGQLYINGEGRLVHWDIFNQENFSGHGQKNYFAGPPTSPIQQGFAIRIESGGKTLERTLDRKGFPGVRFCGEYPIAYVEYTDEGVPVELKLEAFSPFIPLHAEDSALPATLMQFTLKNTGPAPVEVTLTGWLENAVCRPSGQVIPGARLNHVVKGEGWTMVLSSAKSLPPPKEVRKPIVLADFEGNDYADWKVEGEALGQGPARGTLPKQQRVSGFRGKGLVNTYLGGDDPHGKLTSPAFKIERNFISFLIGGGSHAGKTCINLLVDGKVVRTATGNDNEQLRWHNWDVRELAGQEARIEIVDAQSGPWGHINVDQIELRDVPMLVPGGPLEAQPDFGTMALAILDGGAAVRAAAFVSAAHPWTIPPQNPPPTEADISFDEQLVGALEKRVSLAGGQEARISFVIAWHFPNRPEHGNYYARRFKDAAGVVAYIARNFDRLAGQTRLWHDTWYDSTLPHWLLDRLFSTVSTLATGTCQWWANGRFWAWEGVGCCHGTCAHVWNYEHAMARLFPELERSVRIMQDYNPKAGFVEETGAVMFRGEGWKLWAGDSQPGTVLKAYREHQMSADDRFLRQLWPRVRKSLEFMIRQDANDDGLVEGEQHNTYDINFYGPNTMVGSLYLAALRAGEEMATEMGDTQLAARCRRIFEAGRKNTVEKLFNGEYFIQLVDLKKHPKHQYADGCLADQLFGQGWAHQVALGYIYPQDKVRSALGAIWKYNWAPDVGPQNKAHPPQRWFARPGEAGLFTCTWPKSKHLGPESVLYRDEVWTGIEYQVAGNMVWEGMLTEALAICRGVHERYHPSKHNPWNEIECGDHYARAMASYGVFLALCGFEYHGPKGHIGFVPRLGPEDFRAAFTAAEGWGTISQRREGTTALKSVPRQVNRIEVKWGKLRVKTLAFELAEGVKLAQLAVTVAGQPVPAEAKQDGCRVVITLAERVTLQPGESMEVAM